MGPHMLGILLSELPRPACLYTNPAETILHRRVPALAFVVRQNASACAVSPKAFSWRLITRRGFPLPCRFSLGRPRPTAETCGRNFKHPFGVSDPEIRKSPLDLDGSMKSRNKADRGLLGFAPFSIPRLTGTLSYIYWQSHFPEASSRWDILAVQRELRGLVAGLRRTRLPCKPHRGGILLFFYLYFC